MTRFEAPSPFQPDVTIPVPEGYRPPSRRTGNVWEEFIRVVEFRADAPAVRHGGHEVGYRRLQQMAAAFGVDVAERVPGRSRPIAIAMQNSIASVAAVLGVLGAGHVYLPLDPRSPQERLARMLESAGAALAIVDDDDGPGAAAARSLGLPVMTVTALPPEHAAPFGVPVGRDAPARLLYTSGSTGEPKGVPRSHEHLLAATNRSIESVFLSPEDRLALSGHISFGLASSAVFAALLGGATLCLHDTPRLGLASFADWVDDEGVTVLVMVPAAFRTAFGSLDPDRRVTSVRAIRMGGDRALRIDAEIFRRHFRPDAVLVNTLGASEIGSIAQYVMRADGRLPAGPLPVGYARDPIRIVDDRGDEVPRGSVGEILVHRARLLGYWNSPAEQNARFRADPDGGYWYATGDLAVMRPDGCVEYVGRVDEMIKVAGQAVQPAEIEHALLNLEGVEEAIVVAVANAAGDAELHAFVRTETGEVKESFSREALGDALPSYAIPARFHALSEVPLSARGKVDRHALREAAEAVVRSTAADAARLLRGMPGVVDAAVVQLEIDGSKERVAFFVPADGGVRAASVRRVLSARLAPDQVPARLVAIPALPRAQDGTLQVDRLPDPRTVTIVERERGAGRYDLEYRIMEMWEEILGVLVGPEDDFFSLGGTSLQAMDVFSRIHAAYGVDLSPTEMLEASTPRALAEVVQRHAFRPRRRSIVEFRREGSRTPIFHIHGGRGHVLHLRILAQYAHPDRPVYGFEQPGLHGKQRPLRTVEAMADRYTRDLVDVYPEGPVVLTGHSFGGLVALEMARRLEGLGREVELLVVFDTKFSGPAGHDPDVGTIARAKQALRIRKARAVLGTKLRLGIPIPYEHRTLYFWWLHVAAARRYRPAPYPKGKVLVVAERGSSSYHEEIWTKIAPGRFEIVELPIEHDQLIEEPYIVDVMRLVESRIDG